MIDGFKLVALHVRKEVCAHCGKCVADTQVLMKGFDRKGRLIVVRFRCAGCPAMYDLRRQGYGWLLRRVVV